MIPSSLPDRGLGATRPYPLGGLDAVRNGFVWATIIVCASIVGASIVCVRKAQASGQPRVPEPLQSEAQGSPDAPRQQPESGAWRHFGQADQSPAPAPAPGKPGVWRHFGGKDAAPKANPHPTATRPRLNASPIPELEKQMYELINHDRSNPANAAETRGRARPLRWNEQLAAVARAHSRDMIRQGFFDHVDPEGRSSGERVSAAGIQWQAVGENIAIYDGVTGAEGAFMREPRFEENHRANILNPNYTDVGVGIAQAPDGRYYITQDFLASPPGLRRSPESSSGGGETGRAIPSGR